MKFCLIKTLSLFCLLVQISACNSEQPEAINQAPALMIGEPAPDFEFSSLMKSGEQAVKLSDYRGKVIYLDFWASWCKACLRSMPAFNQERKYLKDFGFEVIAVNIDEIVKNGQDFILEHPVGYPVVRAANNNISEVYKLVGLPTGFLIDKNGILQLVHQGFNEKDMKEIKRQIVQLLK